MSEALLFHDTEAERQQEKPRKKIKKKQDEGGGRIRLVREGVGEKEWLWFTWVTFKKVPSF